MVALLELHYGQLPVTTAAGFQAFDQTDFAKLTVNNKIFSFYEVRQTPEFAQPIAGIHLLIL
ncbi:hypothetical protein [Comamonas terrigena]|uniref:hypothetical protein n=1 Tax=Comamonas terrigena TaxID=32013 RepID=UPI00244A6754|nr:hypothetical protein [Comamonas terrigena]MDH1701040.1 hypothetical protein [Comamonas terrigena]